MQNAHSSVNTGPHTHNTTLYEMHAHFLLITIDINRQNVLDGLLNSANGGNKVTVMLLVEEKKKSRKWTLQYYMPLTHWYLCNLASTWNCPKFSNLSCNPLKEDLQTVPPNHFKSDRTARVKNNTLNGKSWQDSAMLMLHHSCFCLNPARSHLLKILHHCCFIISMQFHSLMVLKNKNAASWLIFLRITEYLIWAFITPHRPSWIATFRLYPHLLRLPVVPWFNLHQNIKARTFKYKRQYCCSIEQSFTSTLFNNRITSRLKTNTRDHNAFIVGVVNSIFKFHPTLRLFYWSVIWSAELLTRPQSSPYRSASLSNNTHQQLHYVHLKPGK